MKSIVNTQPLYMNAACLVNKWIYFTSYNSNWLFKLNIDTKDIEAVHQLNGPKTGMKFSGLYYYNNQIWMIPWSIDYIYIYNLINSKLEQLFLPKEMFEYNHMIKFRKSILQEKYLWLLPCSYPGIIRIDMDEKVYKIYNDWPVNVNFDKTKKMNFKMMTLYENNLYLFNDACNISIKMSTETGKMTEWKEGYDHSFGVIDKNKLYTCPTKEYEPIKIITLGEIQKTETISLPNKLWMNRKNYSNFIYSYWYCKIVGSKVIYMPHEANGIIIMDLIKEKINIIEIDISDYITPREHKNYAVYDVLRYKDNYLVIPYQGNKIILITSNGLIKKEFLLQTDMKYFVQSMNESNQNNMLQFLETIGHFNVKMTNWGYKDCSMVDKSIGAAINRKILEGIE